MSFTESYLWPPLDIVHVFNYCCFTAQRSKKIILALLDLFIFNFLVVIRMMAILSDMTGKNKDKFLETRSIICNNFFESNYLPPCEIKIGAMIAMMSSTNLDLSPIREIGRSVTRSPLSRRL